MYESFYNLAVAPFHNTPNSRFFFETEQHKEALAKLEYTVRNRRGFALVTGEVGSGKTTLIRTLLRRVGSDVRAALINNTRVTAAQLLRMLCHDLGIEVPATADKSTMLVRLRRFVEGQQAVGRNVVVIIDEGQCLTIDDFEELRLLTNLESETDKLVQLLILGQPELRDTLRHPRLKPLIQRIAMYCHLVPMSFDDMTRYIAFRLVRASKGRPNVDFSREALQLIYEYSKGTPRLVNLACDNALLVGYSSDTRLIDSAVVKRAVTQMLPNFDAPLADNGMETAEDAGPGPEPERAASEEDSARTRPSAEQELDDGRRI